jgi:hypothetical protein
VGYDLERIHEEVEAGGGGAYTVRCLIIYAKRAFIFSPVDEKYDDGSKPFYSGPDFLVKAGLFLAEHGNKIKEVEVQFV